MMFQPKLFTSQSKLQHDTANNQQPTRSEIWMHKMAWVHTQPGFKCLVWTATALAVLMIAGLIAFIAAAHLSSQTYRFRWLPPSSATINRPQVSDTMLTVNMVMIPSQSQAAVHATSDADWPFAHVQSIIDFDQGHSIHTESRLPSYCFVMPTPQGQMYSEIRHAADDTSQDPHRASNGTWTLNYNWRLHVVQDALRRHYTYDEMAQCDNGTILLLQPSHDPHQCAINMCTEVCLPEYGVDTWGQLAITKRQCFWLYVPEWHSANQNNDAATNRKLLAAFYQGLTANNGGHHKTQPISPQDNWVQVGYNPRGR